MQPLSLESLLPYLWISGRSSRREWWRVHLFCAMMLFVLEQMAHAWLERRLAGDGMSTQAVSMLWLLVSTALTWVSWTSVVRRLHDRGKSGWWSLLYLLPGIGWLWLIIECGFLPGRAAAAPAAPQPVFAPQPEPPRAPRASRASLSTVQRVGTIQRVEYRPWTRARALKLACNLVGLILLALVLYQWFSDGRLMPTFEFPAKSEPAQ